MNGEKPKGFARFYHSLLSRYLLIIAVALLFIPIIFPLASIAYLISEHALHSDKAFGPKYGDSAVLKERWHEAAAALASDDAERIDEKLREMKERYPESSVFWVDSDGRTRLQLPEQPRLPERWTPAEAIRYMKEHVDSDPYTVVAFIGGGDGFMVFQLPRSLLEAMKPIGAGTPFYMGFVLVLFAMFVLLSLLFFRHIRRRLVRLQEAMARRDGSGLPQPVALKKLDEIGQLEAAFNEMVEQLRVSRENGREEEELRKKLISSLSHDLRTPLTVMNGHLYSLRREPLSPAALQSVGQLERKIDDLGSLIENLLSYSLMSSGRYPLKPERLDVARIVRESAAAWYPLWEKEGIEPHIEVDDPKGPLLWRVDREGFRRVLDNLFQNVVRHAAEGRYIGIALVPWEGRTALVIADRGSGRALSPDRKGAGIGLAIVDYLIREMGLEWRTEASDTGTRVWIYPRAARDSNAI